MGLQQVCPRCGARVDPEERRCHACEGSLFRRCTCGEEVRVSLGRCPVCGRSGRRRRVRKGGGVRRVVGGVAAEAGRLLSRACALPGRMVAGLGLLVRPEGRRRRKCPECGAKLTERTDECPACGASLTRDCRCGGAYHKILDRRCPACGRATSGRRRRRSKQAHRTGMALAGLLVVALSAWRLWPDRESHPESAWSSEGRVALASGRYAEAVEKFRKTVSKRPGDARAHLQLARSLWKLGEREEALREGRRALDLKPTAEVYGVLGRWSFAEGRDAEALKLLAEGKEEGRLPSEALATLGCLHVRQGRTTLGIEEVREALKGQMDELPVGALLEVVAHLEKRFAVLGRPEEHELARKISGRIVRWCLMGDEQEEDPERDWALPKAYLALDRAEAARQWARRGADRLTGPRRADMLLVMARIDASGGGLEEDVERSLEEAARCDPSARRRIALADFWRDLGNPERGREILKAARSRFPGDLGILTAWARGEAEAGRAIEAAKGLAEESLEFGEEAAFHLELAAAQKLAGALADAMRTLETARDRFPGDASVQREWLRVRLEALTEGSGADRSEAKRAALLARRLSGGDSPLPSLRVLEGLALLVDRNWPKAIKVFTELTESDPLNLDWELQLGRALFLSRDYDEAARRLEGALRRTGAELPRMRKMLVKALYRSGLYRRATTESLENLKRRPRDAEALRLLGRILMVSGDFEGAIDSLREAEGLEPGDPLAPLCRAYAQMAVRAGAVSGEALLGALDLAKSPEAVAVYSRAEAEILRQSAAMSEAVGVEPIERTPVDVADFFLALGLRGEASGVYEQKAAKSPREIEVRRGLCEVRFRELRDLSPVDRQIADIEEWAGGSPELLYLRGQRLALGGNPGRGVPLLERYVEARPRDWRGLRALASALIRAGRAAAALEPLRRAAMVLPRARRVRRALVGAAIEEAARLYAEGTADDVVHLVRRVLGYRPPAGGRGLRVSEALVALGAAAPGDAVGGEDPGLVDGRGAVRLLGLVRLRREEFEAARDAFAESGTMGEPGGLDQHLLALAKMGLGDTRGALEAADRARSRSKDPLLSSEVALACRLRSGDGKGAVRLAEDLVKKHPRSGAALTLRGVARRETGALEGAAADFARALEFDQGSLFTIGEWLELRTRGGRAPDPGLSWLESLLERRPEDPDLAFLRGRLLSRADRPLEAARALGRAIAANPRHRAAALLRARAFRALGSADDVARAVEAALVRDPGDADALLLAARSHERRGEPEAAVRRYRQCLLSRLDSIAAREGLARLRLAEEDGAAEALRVIREAVEIAPGHPVLLLTLGRACLLVNRVDEARGHLSRAVAGLGEWKDAGGRPGRVSHRSFPFVREQRERWIEIARESLESLGGD